MSAGVQRATASANTGRASGEVSDESMIPGCRGTLGSGHRSAEPAKDGHEPLSTGRRTAGPGRNGRGRRSRSGAGPSSPPADCAHDCRSAPVRQSCSLPPRRTPVGMSWSWSRSTPRRTSTDSDRPTRLGSRRPPPHRRGTTTSASAGPRASNRPSCGPATRRRTGIRGPRERARRTEQRPRPGQVQSRAVRRLRPCSRW